jgi:GGDEF domain-containing protein
VKQETATKRILCLHGKAPSCDRLKNVLTDRGYTVSTFSDANDAFTAVFSEPPNIIIVSTDILGWKDFMNRIKNDSVYKHLPLLLLTKEEILNSLMSCTDLSCDDFFLFPVSPEEILLRIQLRETNATLNLDANPLTRLPGNVTIMATIQKTIDYREEAALCYLDLDNFKAFNDCYGFARGDEALRMTGRVVTNVVNKASNSDGFVGHIGGDDFFFIVPADLAKQCCQQIIGNFDTVITTLIDDEDKDRGFIESKDRKGNPQRFPILSASIAVIDLTITTINHPGEASAIAGELKKAVKKRAGSNFMVNRRKSLKA